MKKFSVVMPVYNVEQFVADAIRSVLNQTYPHFELIIIDDCSPDNSVAICQSFTDSRIKIISHKSNKGLAASRNTGIRAACGDFIAFLDSDDLWHPEKLERHLCHLELNPGVGLSFSRSAFIDYQGNPTDCFQMPRLTNIDPAHLLCRNPVGNGSAPVIRKTVMDAIRFNQFTPSGFIDSYFDESFRQSEDIECWVRIALQTQWQIEGIPEPLTFYRLNQGGLSSNLFAQYESWQKMIIKLTAYAPRFARSYASLARAYQLRYLARQAVRLNDGKTALRFLTMALTQNFRILFQEPGRTIATLIASLSLKVTPKLFEKYEKTLFSIWGKHQQRKIHQETL